MTANNNSINLIAVGDIMLGEHPIMIGWGVKSLLENDKSYNPFEHISPLLQSANVTFGNLESSLSDSIPNNSKGDPNCIGPEIGANLLKHSGFDIVSIANNHIQQYGESTMLHTLELLKDNGVEYVGLSQDDSTGCVPNDIYVDGISLRFLAYSLRPRQFFTTKPLYAEPDSETILNDIKEGCKSVDHVIVSIHWGDEFVPQPSLEQIKLGDMMIDAGASVILGHHPHVLQKYRRYKNGVIAYSLGNCVFDMGWNKVLKQGAILNCKLTKDSVEDIDLIPTLSDDLHCPVIQHNKETPSCLREITQQEIEITSEQYNSKLNYFKSKQQRSSHIHFLKNLHRYKLANISHILSKAISQRIKGEV